MAEESEKLLFRLQHIIPRSLSAASSSNISSSANKTNSVDTPEELTFQMSFGKLAGKNDIIFASIARRVNKSAFFVLKAKVWGPPDGLPVFALHGWLDNAGSFDTLIPLLPKNLRIVAVDTAGHGLSDPFPPDIAYNFVVRTLYIRFIWIYTYANCNFTCILGLLARHRTISQTLQLEQIFAYRTQSWRCDGNVICRNIPGKS